MATWLACINRTSDTALLSVTVLDPLAGRVHRALSDEPLRGSGRCCALTSQVSRSATERTRPAAKSGPW
ncbi:hypothetical protein GCM10018789_23910 [Streptomyces werraensis]|nr:hypothetical protein GCM10018789_23910 [Streptomyces werraensis]